MFLDRYSGGLRPAARDVIASFFVDVITTTPTPTPKFVCDYSFKTGYAHTHPPFAHLEMKKINKYDQNNFKICGVSAVVLKLVFFS